jgi:hypothetical protein
MNVNNYKKDFLSFKVLDVLDIVFNKYATRLPILA